MLAPEQHLMCQLLLCFVLFVCFFLAVLMDFTSLLLSSENIKEDHSGCVDAKVVLWRNLAVQHPFLDWWSLYIFTWLHLHKICGLLTALSGHGGSTLGCVRVPVHYTLHHFTADTLQSCCHQPEQSFYASLNPIFFSPRKTGFKHAKIFCGKMKENKVWDFYISISDNFFWFAFAFSICFLRYINVFHSWTVKVVWENQTLDYFDP